MSYQSQRFGEPDHVKREDHVLTYAQWLVSADGDFSTIVDISKATSEGGPVVILGIARGNPNAPAEMAGNQKTKRRRPPVNEPASR